MRASVERTVMLAACGAALATLVPVALYQCGALEHLPDPSGRLFDSDEITGSAMAHPFGVPDSLLGIASYSATLALILVTRPSRAAKTLLAGKLLIDASAASFNSVRQVKRFGKLCSWCVGTALATGVMVYAGRRVIVESATKLCGCHR